MPKSSWLGLSELQLSAGADEGIDIVDIVAPTLLKVTQAMASRSSRACSRWPRS